MKHPVVWFEVMGKDASKTQRFYGELFDWKIDADNPMKYGIVAHEGAEGIPGGVGERSGQNQHGVTFYVQSRDLEGSLKRAESLGGEVVLEPAMLPGGGRIALFSDPEGNIVGLVDA